VNPPARAPTLVGMTESRDEQVRELEAASRHRRRLDREMTMSERLAALHELCMQLADVTGSAKRK
jgi:hypothetical protein